MFKVILSFHVIKKKCGMFWTAICTASRLAVVFSRWCLWEKSGWPHTFTDEASDDNVEPILRILKIPIQLDPSSSPVMKKNRDTWTKKERGRAEEAQVLGGHEETYQRQASSEAKSDGIDSPSSSAQHVLQQWQKGNGKVYSTGFQWATKVNLMQSVMVYSKAYNKSVMLLGLKTRTEQLLGFLSET